jgi:hypothetical protein
MTTLLEKAVKKISGLPETEQDKIAKIILEEIEDEHTWYNKFKNNQSKLSILAGEARKEFKSGKTKELKL